MISTAEALAHCLALVRPLGSETVPLTLAGGRVLAEGFSAKRDQPPFPASAMDGYALTDAAPGKRYHVVGESAAGHGWTGELAAGQALRIFTGAPVPTGADRVVIQEDVVRDGDHVQLGDNLDKGTHIRPDGADFRVGQIGAEAGTKATPATVALAASMGHSGLMVAKRPDVAIIATGDELVPPGTAPGPDQIIASNSYGLKAMAEAAGATARLLPIAQDTTESLTAVFELARDADLIVTIGGASVGDHDLVGPTAEGLGMTRAFYKIAMRPGKPLMAGRLGGAVMLGLPGNPVSSMVCGQIFMVPMIAAMMGQPAAAATRHQATLTHGMAANGPREHYMRAEVRDGKITPVDNQDSALLTRLAAANALLVRAPHDPEQPAGATVEYIQLLS